MTAAPQLSLDPPGVLSDRLAIRLNWALTTFVVAAGAYATSLTALNHDVASYLLMARALVDGRVLYDSFPDFSMPANAWLALLSLKVATATGLELAALHQFVLFMLTVAGATVTGLVISRSVAADTLAARAMPAAVMALFLFVPGYDAGQRDVLFAVLAAPVVAIVAARHFDFRPSIVISTVAVLLGATGSSLKPQVALPLLALGGCELVLRRGNLRRLAPELWALAAVLLAYVAVIQAMYPTYFWQVLPTATKFFAFQNLPLVALLPSLWKIAIAGFVALVLLAFLLAHRASAGLPIPWGMLGAWAAFASALVAMHLQQRMGFRYHTVPAVLFLLVSVALFTLMGVEAALRRWAVGARLIPGLCLVAAGTLGPFAIQVGVLFNRPDGTTRADALGDRVTRIFHALPPASYVLSFQTGVPPMSPLHAYADVRWSGEFNTNYEISGIVLDADRAVAEGGERDPFFVSVERELRRSVLKSLTVRPPEVVLVDVTKPLRWFEHYDKPFGLLAWLAQDPAFATAWSNYEHVETVESFLNVSVEIWRRRAVAGG
jgi:hypothetical protein